jgi:hypothetical protein
MSRELTEKIRRLSATVARLDRAAGSSVGLARPPIGSFIAPTGLMTVSTAAPTSGRVTFLPFDVNQTATFSDIGFRIGTNAVGGAVELTAGIYADNGEGNAPNLTRRLAYTPVGDTLTTGTNREIPLDQQVRLTPGRYWIGTLYRQVTAPTTSPTLHHGNIISLGYLNSGILWFNGAYPARCLYVNGLTSLPTTAIALSLGYSEQPIIGVLKRSA